MIGGARGARGRGRGDEPREAPGLPRERSRRRRGWLGLRVALLAALVSLTPLMDAAATSPGIVVSLATDKPTYRPGEPIVMTLDVANHAAEEVPLRFTSAQRFDFIIRDAKGGQAWLWSEGQMFASVIGIETIGPRRPRLSYQGEFRGNLAPGLYSVEGRLMAKNRPLTATLLIEVR